MFEEKNLKTWLFRIKFVWLKSPKKIKCYNSPLYRAKSFYCEKREGYNDVVFTPRVAANWDEDNSPPPILSPRCTGLKQQARVGLPFLPKGGRLACCVVWMYGLNLIIVSQINAKHFLNRKIWNKRHTNFCQDKNYLSFF